VCVGLNCVGQIEYSYIHTFGSQTSARHRVEKYMKNISFPSETQMKAQKRELHCNRRLQLGAAIHAEVHAEPFTADCLARALYALKIR